MSAGLLLRLFQSSYFNVHLAVSYLRTYPDSIGITYYLVHRLAQVPESELEFYWPQICHLVVTQNSESGALEGFVVKICQESIHLAMLTLWQMQASLADLSSDPKTASFATCRRLYNKVQSVVFSDALLESSIEACHRRSKLNGHRVKSALAGIGIAAAAVALPRMAVFEGQMAVEEGKKEHGLDSNSSIEEQASRASDVSSDAEANSPAGSERRNERSGPSLTSHALSRSASNASRATYVRAQAQDTAPGLQSRFTGDFKSHEHSRLTTPSFIPGAALPLANTLESLQGYLSNAHASDTLLPVASKSLRKTYYPKGHPASSDKDSSPVSAHSMSMVDLSLRHERINDFKSTPRHTTTHASSSRKKLVNHITSVADLARSPKPLPTRFSLGTGRHAASTPTLNGHAQTSDGLFHAKSMLYDLPSATLSLLLRSYACRSQLDFLTGLQDIATHLVNVPKAARLSALRAELTLLNHRLPRGCCLCLGCSGQDCGSLVTAESRETPRSSSHTLAYPSVFSRSSTIRPVNHHRVIRICPSEAVVLNSADRAPYLIVVEVLENDLDFDPSRRQNAEDLRNVRAEREGRNVRDERPDRPHRYTSSSTPVHDDAQHHSRETQKLDAESSDGEIISPVLSPSPPHMQARGLGIEEPKTSNGQSIATATTTSLEEIDLVEQMYGGMSVHDFAALPSPQYHEDIRNRAVDEKAWKAINENCSDPLSSVQGQSSPKTLSNVSAREDGLSPKILTIDQYAERMRVAAVMLAQLAASQQLPMTRAEAVTGVVGAGVGLGVNLTYGVGNVVGAMVGVGVEAMRTSIAGRLQPAAGTSEGNKDRMDITNLSPVFDGAISSNPSATGAAPSDIPLATMSAPLPFPVSRAVNGLDKRSAPASSTAAVPARQRVLSVAEATSIRARIMDEMLALEEERMARMTVASHPSKEASLLANAPAETTEEESVVLRALNKDDPSGSVLSESWAEKKSRIRKSSPYGHLLHWDVISVIVKTGADLRQEQLAVQLIAEFGRIWSEVQCPHWIRYFRILVTSESTGLMETITDAVSVHSLKKAAYVKLTSRKAAVSGLLPSYTLYDHFVETFGPPESPRFRRAQEEFMKSLASYSIITYLLQIKDRHNGNILIDKDGHIVHIDFGFMLSNSPGSLGFEKAPFKLTQDYIDILGGVDSSKFQEYRTLLKRQFREARQHAEKIIILVELMQRSSRLPCFSSGRLCVQHLRDRFQLGLPISAVDNYVDRLVVSSAGSAYTRLYDTFQRHSQGVL